MSTYLPSAVLLVADTDPESRAAVAEVLHEAGWRVEEAGDVDACREALTRRPRVALIAIELAGEAPLTFCRDLKDTPGGAECHLVLTIDPDQDHDFEALTAAGAEDFLERPLRPNLLRHRLKRLLPIEDHDVEDAPGSWLDQESFLARLSGRLVHASGEESKVAVISAVIEDTARDRDWSALSTTADHALMERLARTMRAAFEGDDEIGGLYPLLSGMRLSRVESNVVAMMIPGVTRLQDTAKIGARLQERFLAPFEVDGQSVSMQVGLGVAAFPEDGREGGQLIWNATEAARRARREGSTLMVFHTEAMGRWAFERLTLERSLREAIAREELRVFYQPRIDTETRRIKGMEGLVRWQHPELGLVPPMQFIPLAEETGLIVPIGEWVLNEACRQNKAWRDAGLPPIRVSVNLSPVQFRKPDLFEVVLEALALVGLPEDGLELEVTESMLMNDPKQTIETLQRLKSAGIHISIDDFGTGYSSLSYLKRFPIDALKIDRSFITDVTTNPDDAAIATAIILMGHSLKLSVVAEGVETESQLEFLRVLQCNEIQGYLFSPPVPADHAERMLRAQDVDTKAA